MRSESVVSAGCAEFAVTDDKWVNVFHGNRWSRYWTALNIAVGFTARLGIAFVGGEHGHTVFYSLCTR